MVGLWFLVPAIGALTVWETVKEVVDTFLKENIIQPELIL